MDDHRSGFWTYVLTWVGVFLSGWLTFGFAHLVAGWALQAFTIQQTAVVTACFGALVGVVVWLTNKEIG